MKLLRAKCAAVALGAMLCLGSLAQGQNSPLPAQSPERPPHQPSQSHYDRDRDAGADIQQALAESKKSGKNVLLEIGGDWCLWCHALERFYVQHPDLAALRQQNFITVYVYYGSDNKNEKPLSRYPKIHAVPHFFVLDQNGNLLVSKTMPELEVADQPDIEKIRAFLTKEATLVPAKRADQQPSPGERVAAGGRQ
jgi:thiol:disulfide interchange protein